VLQSGAFPGASQSRSLHNLPADSSHWTGLAKLSLIRGCNQKLELTLVVAEVVVVVVLVEEIIVDLMCQLT